MEEEKIKMYCIMAMESMTKMNGIRGKMITQGGHGYVHAFWDSQKRFPAAAQAYMDANRAYKITLVVETVEELKEIEARYRDICGVSLVTDAGFTVFAEPTTTCLGLGPIFERDIGDDLKGLRTLT